MLISEKRFAEMEAVPAASITPASSIMIFRSYPYMEVEGIKTVFALATSRTAFFPGAWRA